MSCHNRDMMLGVNLVFNSMEVTMISKEKIQEVLKKKGVNLVQIATDPRVFDKACGIIYKSIPIPLRWFVGKKRVRKTMNRLKEQIPQMKRQPSKQSRPATSGRL